MKQEIVYGINYTPYGEGIKINSVEDLNRKIKVVDDLIIYTPDAHPTRFFFTNLSDVIKVSSYLNYNTNDGKYGFYELARSDFDRIKQTIDDKASQLNIPYEMYKQMRITLYGSKAQFFKSMEEDLER